MSHFRAAPSSLDMDSSDALAVSSGTALYEQSAGLLAVAGALRAAAHEPAGPAAISATLACVEASLEALAGAVQQLGVGAIDRLADRPSPRVDAALPAQR